MSKKDNEVISAFTHLIGVFLSIAALVLLIVFSSIYSTAKSVVAVTIFGSSMFLLYLASTLYHFFEKNTKLKEIFRKIDHSMIYILIAGTYTPICFMVLEGWLSWTIFGIIWGLALIGIILKLFTNILNPKLSGLLYILMGWLVIIVIKPIMDNLSNIEFFWLLLGGVFYTIGFIFFSLENIVKKKLKFGMHEIFHIFVMLGSFSHFWLIFWYLI